MFSSGLSVFQVNLMIVDFSCQPVHLLIVLCWRVDYITEMLDSIVLMSLFIAVSILYVFINPASLS